MPGWRKKPNVKVIEPTASISERLDLGPEETHETEPETLKRQLQAEVAAHNDTRRRLSQANRQLDLIRARAAWLLGDSFPDETIEEIEEVLEARPQ